MTQNTRPQGSARQRLPLAERGATIELWAAKEDDGSVYCFTARGPKEEIIDLHDLFAGLPCAAVRVRISVEEVLGGRTLTDREVEYGRKLAKGGLREADS